MSQLTAPTESCQDHLKKALEADNSTEKNYHIRQAMQICQSVVDLQKLE